MTGNLSLPFVGSRLLTAVLLAGLLGGCAVTAPLPAAAPAPIPIPLPAADPEPAPDPAEALVAGLVGRGRLDPEQDAVRLDLWQRVRDGFAMPDLDDERVRKWELHYAGRPDDVQRMTERGSRYLFHIVEEAHRRGLPLELALLPFIESAFNPQALSAARAAGMWQFMPATGRDFELTQNLFRDDRRDILASTRAAFDYLQMLHGIFGDWHLALAAYNWGQGNVQRAVARNRVRGLPTDYVSLRMPDETRDYVPKLQAVKNIIAAPSKFSLTLPALENHPYFLSVAIERDIDVDIAARLAGLSAEEFKQLNPQLNKPVILAAGTPRVLLPYDNANRFLRQLEIHRGALASWTAWVAPKTMQPADVARHVHMDEAELRAVNRIPPRMLIKRGSTLLVPRAAMRDDDVAVEIADSAMILFAPDAPPRRKRVLKVGKKGDSVAGVARRYGLDAAEVAAWNKVRVGATFRPGQFVTLMLAPKSAKAPTRASKTAKAKNRSAKSPAPRATRRAAAKPTSKTAARSGSDDGVATR